jgi:ProP effector
LAAQKKAPGDANVRGRKGSPCPEANANGAPGGNYPARRQAPILDTPAALSEWFPRAFTSPRSPLKIGIHHDIAERASAITSREVRDALKFYCRTPAYQRALIEGAARVGVDGETAGIVTAAQAAIAKAKITALREKWKTSRPSPAPLAHESAKVAARPIIDLGGRWKFKRGSATP